MDDWISGTTGSTTNYSSQGTASQNSRITTTGPYGDQVTVWEGSADGASGMNGGLEHSGVVVDTDKTYRISFWVRSNGLNNCSNTIGFVPYHIGGGLVQPFENENGGNVSWPYVSSMNYPNDKWFLVVGYIRPPSASDMGDSGVYDPSLGTAPNLPSISYGTTDFIFPSSVSQIRIRIRAFMWACATGEKMYVYDPRLEEVPNTMPLNDLLYGTGGGDTQNPTAPTLSITSQSDTTVDLSWSGATDNVGVTGYKIFKDNSLETTLGNVNTYQVAGLTESTSYNFTATALDAAGNESSASNSISVTTNASSGSGGGSSIWTEANSVASYSGDVGIGTNAVPSGYKLAVEGKIRTREIRVDQDTWPDYVFKEGYDLPSLEEIQKHIEEKGHLPNIPSAKEVETNGVELGEMNKLLLEKVEELTLYVIELKKENEKQNQIIKNYHFKK
ncbi:fibronectin type III domain-containing protein [Flagellimonas sp.]|uniref:fibronectin type III domain-containing protein n=1 Tax=Flagellimonas sp. TaxID=2058762 RepID=UPI003B5C3DCF